MFVPIPLLIPEEHRKSSLRSSCYIDIKSTQLRHRFKAIFNLLNCPSAHRHIIHKMSSILLNEILPVVVVE